MNKSLHPCGVIFLDKPKGWSSRQAVNRVIHLFAKPEQKNRRRRLKAGHTGTLDPLATGMLPILLGDATRFSDMGLSAQKSYEVTFDLSFQTETLDLEGEVTSRFEHVGVTQAELESILQGFQGKQLQVPPVYSAIRVGGKRAHVKVRCGEHVQLSPREVEVYRIQLLAFEGSKVTMEVDCSKGTYIRALVRDIGLALGYGGCVTDLRRTSTGGWSTQMMVTPADLEEKKEACILPLRLWLKDLPSVELTAVEAKRFVQGQRLPWVNEMENQALCCIVYDDLVLGTAIYQQKGRGVLQPKHVLPSVQEMLR